MRNIVNSTEYMQVFTFNPHLIHLFVTTFLTLFLKVSNLQGKDCDTNSGFVNNLGSSAGNRTDWSNVSLRGWGSGFASFSISSFLAFCGRE
jgi:hypothetical protein